MTTRREALAAFSCLPIVVQAHVRAAIMEDAIRIACVVYQQLHPVEGQQRELDPAELVGASGDPTDLGLSPVESSELADDAEQLAGDAPGDPNDLGPVESSELAGDPNQLAPIDFAGDELLDDARTTLAGDALPGDELDALAGDELDADDANVDDVDDANVARAGDELDAESTPTMRPRTVGERPKTSANRRVTTVERDVAAFLYPERNYPRPRVRADCVNGVRPCPYAGCRYHLGFEAKATGLVVLRPDVEVWDLPHSCALDEAGEPRTLEEVATILNITRERVRQIEASALQKCAESGVEFEQPLAPEGLSVLLPMER